MDRQNKYLQHTCGLQKNQEIRVSLSGSCFKRMFQFTYLKPAPGNETHFLSFSDVRRVLVSDAYFEKSTFRKINT